MIGPFPLMYKNCLELLPGEASNGQKFPAFFNVGNEKFLQSIQSKAG
jgi:hypothetical protein